MRSASVACGRVRHVLWPAAGPRSVTPVIVEAQAHLERCAQCRAFLEDMQAVANAVHAAAPREEAPAEVRSRL
ncbi:MAG: hypothetical protein ACT4R6_12885, partial [Gemmatimonadaceae bacterium]